MTTTRSRAGGRKTLPLGREIPGCPLRVPPGIPQGCPWPPTVDQARRQFDSLRNPMRSALVPFNLAGALALRGIRGGETATADLVEATELFNLIAASEHGEKFQHYRGLALFNATTCMQALPTREAKKVAAELLLRAVEAIGDSITEGIRSAIAAKAAELEKATKPLRLTWRNPSTLAAAEPDARAIIPTLPRIEGTWTDVSAELLDRGLFAPRNLHLPVECRRIVAQPRIQIIKVMALR